MKSTLTKLTVGSLVRGDVLLNQKVEEQEALILEVDGQRITVPASEVARPVETYGLNRFVGRQLPVVITAFDEVKQSFIGSHRQATEQLKESVLHALQSHQPVQAVITKFLGFGAYLDLDGVSLLLQNSQFSTDHTKVRDVHREGDVLTVQLKEFKEVGAHVVEATHKHTSPTIVNVEDFQPNNSMRGEVVSVLPDKIFVRLAPGVDGLCSHPPFGEVQIGDVVRFFIKRAEVNENQQLRVRGRIDAVLPS